jgi:DNA circularisation protein N-terminus
MSDTASTAENILTIETTEGDAAPAFVSRLRPARFTSPSGAESVFLFDSLSRSRAKKGSAHDVLDADTTVLQDMGSSLHVFNIAAYFVGADCDKQADAFFASLY